MDPKGLKGRPAKHFSLRRETARHKDTPLPNLLRGVGFRAWGLRSRRCSFRALSGCLKFTVRRHKLNTGSFSFGVHGAAPSLVRDTLLLDLRSAFRCGARRLAIQTTKLRFQICWGGYRDTSLIRKRSFPQDTPRTLGIGLR